MLLWNVLLEAPQHAKFETQFHSLSDVVANSYARTKEYQRHVAF